MIQNERLSPCTLPSLISSPSCFGGSPITTPVKAPPAAFRSKVRLSTGPPGTSKEPFHLPVASAANATAPSSSERLRATRVRFMGVILTFQEGPSKKILVFEVRHWISNHEAGIGEPKAGNTVGTTFYGSQGYLSMWDG